MPQLPHIAAVGGDPGPARALAPVLENLAERDQAEVVALCYGQAKDIWQKLGISQRPLPVELPASDAISILKDVNASALVVGTSYNDHMLEHIFIDAARTLGLPSLAVLDFPSHFKARFSSRDGRLNHLPDAICVDSQETKQRMLEDGFAESMIKVTGAPAFDALADFSASFSTQRRQEIRQVLGAGQNDLLVLFASQPLANFYNIRPGSLGELGFDELSVLELTTRTLDEVSRDAGRSLSLVVRPHPREDPSKFTPLIRQYPLLTVSDRFTSWEAILAADLVVGMNSVLLMEACHLKRIVVSVQPGLRQPDTLPTNLSGHSLAVYDPALLKPALQGLLFDDSARRLALERLKGLHSDGMAAARVAELVLEMVKAKH